MHTQTAVGKRTLVPVMITALLTGSLGFWAGSRNSEPALPFGKELQRQSANLVRIEQRLAELAQRPTAPLVHCDAAAESKPVPAEDKLALALETALTRQAHAEQAEQEARVQPTSAHFAAFTRGEQLVDAALRASQWTDTQASALRDVISELTEEQATTLMRRLFVAVNAGKVAVRTSGPPF